MNSVFLYFLLSVLVINISPGPAMMFVLQQSQKNGVKAGLVAATGIELGVFLYVILTALGISAVFNAYPSLYITLQVFGALYLVYLAYTSWPRKQVCPLAIDTNNNHIGIFLKAIFISLTNPKIVLFFMSLIPQFIPSGSGTLTFIVYGMIFNVSGIVVNILVVLFADRATGLLYRFKWFDYVPPMLFIMIAAVTLQASF